MLGPPPRRKNIPGGPAIGADGPPLARPLARQRQRAELRSIRQGLWLHQGPAYVPGGILPGLVDPCIPDMELWRLSHGSGPGAMGFRTGQTCLEAYLSVMKVDVSRLPGVQITALRHETGPARWESSGFSPLPRLDGHGKSTVLPSLWLKLGRTRPGLLQCNRDPSQPSSAVELANLAAYA